MHKYTKTASKPHHFVQYDQASMLLDEIQSFCNCVFLGALLRAGHSIIKGEDRWLSTLLLKQGYRIEYVAVADAETYAPEGFHEFFNQRRRWTPSSIANTVDLLVDYKVS